jgi:competence CoiA-like predicted nuclease
MFFGCHPLIKNRIRPAPGEKAVCPMCGQPLIAKCGDIYVWHWAHKGGGECDPWKEHETEWHLAWKNHFPEDWQEIIIEKQGKKHIADVQTPAGVTIEFQNSPISTATIRARSIFMMI